MAEAAHAPHHPTQKAYWQIFVLLAVITAVEVAIAYIDMPSWLFVGGLTVFMVMKFAIVVGYFMHLRYDINLHRGFFTFGVIGAIAVFVVLLATFRAL
ncbi:MAG: cytochrome C oxidase subunit IV family protein [Acidimicrobiia bacterium]|nr:cytochrome C oxidase subunit IV family protein [Acidimicrobiia bacterium]NNF68904.1 cytochrome C oxidase subunit IV family protein [Acidimicrobiia bacterium]NNK91899.1 cytochrome C oxidase subunit IV family protein [Acidimicrobiia bacterium]